MTMVPVTRNTRLFLTHLLLLLSGGLTGFALALFLGGLPWDFSADLERARQLGIVSKTVMSGYPKKRDLLTFVLAFVLPVSGALAAWLPWALKRKRALSNILQDRRHNNDSRPAHPLRPYLLSLSALLVVAGSFVLNSFYSASFNEVVGAWPFLGEEGEFMEWCQRILNGEVQGKDFFCLYGPLMVYPLALLQKIAGPSVSLGRWYAFGLNLCAYVLLSFVINRIVRNSFVALFAVLFVVVVFPYTLYSANLSPLRYFLGIWPIIPLLHFYAKRENLSLGLAGCAAGVAFFFSQEVGICAVVASMGFLMLDAIHRHSIRDALRLQFVFLAGLALVSVPFVIYFYSRGALVPFLDDLVSYPRLVMLGYGGLAFPSLREAFEFPFAPLVFNNYWLIFVYMTAACLIVTRIVTGNISPQVLAAGYTVLFGVLLFRSALARSSTDKAYMVSPPMFLLLFIALDYYLGVLKYARKLSAKLVVTGTMIIFVIFTPQLSFISTQLEELKEMFFAKGRFVFNPLGTRTVGVEQDDVLHPPDTAQEIQLIADYFSTHISGTYVYFFPNEPAYYFLFNKRNPTRFPMSSLMVTAAMRQEAVADLERNKPEYVVYSTQTWRPDDIPESVQTPEVYQYLVSHYEVVEDRETVIFLRRKQQL